MSKTRLFETRFEVVPCENGGFLVALCDGARMWTGKNYAFTNATDLMRFLHQQDPRVEAPAVNQAGPVVPIPPTYNQAADLKARLLDKHGPAKPGGIAALEKLALPPPLPNGQAKGVWPFVRR